MSEGIETIKYYTVKDVVVATEESDKTVQRYIDRFILTDQRDGEVRRLNEKQYQEILRLLAMKKAGLTPKAIESLLENNLVVVSKTQLDQVEDYLKELALGHSTKFENMDVKLLETNEELQRVTELLSEQEKVIEEQNVKIEMIDALQKEIEELKMNVSKSKSKAWWKLWG